MEADVSVNAANPPNPPNPPPPAPPSNLPMPPSQEPKPRDDPEDKYEDCSECGARVRKEFMGTHKFKTHAIERRAIPKSDGDGNGEGDGDGEKGKDGKRKDDKAKDGKEAPKPKPHRGSWFYGTGVKK